MGWWTKRLAAYLWERDRASATGGRCGGRVGREHMYLHGVLGTGTDFAWQRFLGAAGAAGTPGLGPAFNFHVDTDGTMRLAGR